MSVAAPPEKKVPVVRCVRIWPWQRRRYVREGFAVGEGWLPFAARREMVIAHGSIVMLEPDQRLIHEEMKMHESDAHFAERIRKAAGELAALTAEGAERGLRTELEFGKEFVVGRQHSWVISAAVFKVV